MDPLRFCNLLAGALIVGTLFAEFFLVLPMLRRLDRASALEGLRFAGRLAWKVLPPLGGISTLAALAIVLADPQLARIDVVLLVSGLVLIVLGIVVNLTRYLPADLGVRTAGEDPEVFAAAMKRLWRRHIERMLLFGFGYIAFVASAATI